MSGTEVLVIVGGLLIGYWVVSFFLRSGPAGSRQRTGPSAGAAGEPPPSAPPTSPMQDWHGVLGVPPDATVEQIRSAYRMRISEYHPDKVASLGVELRELAELKAKEITRAYRVAMQLRGFAE